MDAVAATLWFVYVIAVLPDGTASITPHNPTLNAPTREECLAKAHEWATEIATTPSVGSLALWGTCLELDASLAGELN